MLKIKDPKNLMAFLKEAEVHVKKTLDVADVMLTEFKTLKHNDTVDKAAELLAQSPIASLPVLDDAGDLIGEITTADIIRLALPEYIGFISAPNFLDTFDPFENYFVAGRKRTLDEVTRMDCLIVKPDTPIIEVGQFLMDHIGRQVYVCKGKKLVGIINATAFVNNCLQL